MSRPRTLTQLIAEARKLSGHHLVTLDLSPGWCLASAHLPRRYRNGRPHLYSIGRGAKTQKAAVAKLVKALKEAKR